MAEDDPIQRAREQRLLTLALADRIAGARWGESALPGGVSLHAMLSHLLGWDEWVIAALEVSAVRELPGRLISAYRDVDGFNARSVARYANIRRDDLLAGLQGSCMRLTSSALAVGGAEWAQRRIPELAPPRADGDSGKPSRGPSVGGLLRMLCDHEREHCDEVSAAFDVHVDLEQLRAELTGEAKTPSASDQAPQQS